MYKSTIFQDFSVQKLEKMLNTHLPQEKFYFDEFNRLCPKWDFEQTNQKPNKIMELQMIKNSNRRSTKTWQDF